MQKKRPAIVAAPGQLGYAQQVKVGYSGGKIAEAVIMGLRSMTHSFDANQRHVQLKIISDTGSDLVNEGPATSSWTPAGYYMLFLLTADRVPSVAKILQVK